jgi:hypothetical protein
MEFVLESFHKIKRKRMRSQAIAYMYRYYPLSDNKIDKLISEHGVLFDDAVTEQRSFKHHYCLRSNPTYADYYINARTDIRSINFYKREIYTLIVSIWHGNDKLFQAICTRYSLKILPNYVINLSTTTDILIYVRL